jgi:hypothetical protein
MFAVRSAATGVGLGVIATTGAASLKKANHDLLLAQQELRFGYVLSVEGAPALTRSTIGIGSVP